MSLSRVDHRASGTIGCWLRALQYNHTDEQDSNITVIGEELIGPHFLRHVVCAELCLRAFLMCVLTSGTFILHSEGISIYQMGVTSNQSVDGVKRMRKRIV